MRPSPVDAAEHRTGPGEAGSSDRERVQRRSGPRSAGNLARRGQVVRCRFFAGFFGQANRRALWSPQSARLIRTSREVQNNLALTRPGAIAGPFQVSEEPLAMRLAHQCNPAAGRSTTSPGNDQHIARAHMRLHRQHSEHHRNVVDNRRQQADLRCWRWSRPLVVHDVGCQRR